MSKDIIQALRKDLLRGGVSYRHVNRYVRELQNHYEDLKERATTIGFEKDAACKWAQKELGEPDVLVREMINKPELQSYGARYPKLVFLALPVSLYLLAGLTAILMFVGLIQYFRPLNAGYVEPANWVKISATAFQLFLMHILAPIISLLFIRYGLRQQIANKFFFLGIVLLNLVGCAFLLHIQWPDPEAGIHEGSFGATFGYGLIGVKNVMSTKLRLFITLIPLTLAYWWYHQKFVRD